MELLNKLCNINGCSGNEQKVAEFITENIKEFVDSVKTDSLGNVIAHKKGNGKKLMFVTHIDEAGFFTTISDQKEIKVSAVGEIDVKSISNAMIQFENDIWGYFDGKSNEKISEYTVKLLGDYLDLTGKTAVFQPNFTVNNNCIVSKGLSARVGCYILINLIKELKSDFDLYFAFTVKKNIGLKGAKVAGFNINPDFAVVIDCVDCEKPSVIVKDKSYIADNTLKEQLEGCAFTPVVKSDTVTEGCAVQVTGNGIKTAVVGIPVKCLNSRNEIVSVDSIADTINNLKKFTKEEF